MCLLYRVKRGLGGEPGRTVEGVGVRKDEEINLEEIESSQTLGGLVWWSGGSFQGRGERGGCRSYSVVIHTWIHQSHGGNHLLCGNVE